MPQSAFTSDNTRWNAVRRKDALADGVFLYAVRTTKIYCRPVCKAPPRAAGQRGLLRHRRRSRTGRISPVQTLQARLSRADAGKQRRAAVVDSGCLEEMARQAGVSKWHFHRILKTMTDMTPAQYLRHRSGGAPSSYERDLEESCSVARGTDAMTEALGLESWAIESTQSELTADLFTLDDIDFDFDSFITSLDDGLLQPNIL
ncbi:metal binding domain of Ada-domain-containing protein [Apiospora sp. TS-2023a]